MNIKIDFKSFKKIQKLANNKDNNIETMAKRDAWIIGQTILFFAGKECNHSLFNFLK